MKLTQEQVWDGIAEQWWDYRKHAKQGVLKFLKKKKGRILDLGCGSGRNFIKLNGRIYGVDFSANLLKYAKQKAEKLGIKVELKKSSADEIPYEDNFFDAAIFIATLHCLDSKEKREKSLQELKRVLKPEAEAFITVLSKGHRRVKNKGKETFIPWTVEGKKYYRYYYVYDKPELEELMKEAGFEVLKIWVWDDKNIFAIVRKPPQYSGNLSVGRRA